MRLLNEIVAQIRLAVLYDSMESLASTNQRRLDKLLQRAAQDVRAARMIKSMKGSVPGL